MKQQCLCFRKEDLSIDLCEYLLFIPPDDRTTKWIGNLKNLARGICKWKGVFTPAHITIASFWAGQHLEPLLIQVLQSICDKQFQFIVRFRNVGGFENRDSCTVYIAIEEHQPFLQFANDLRLLSATLQSGGYRVATRVNHPHCTIGRGLPQANYIEAMDFFTDETFNDAFVANTVLLMRKRFMDKGSQVIATFQLPNPHYLLN